MDNKNKDQENALERKCKCGCGKLFKLNREWQKFYPGHQKEYWKRVQNDKVFLLRRLEKLEEKLSDK